MQTAFRRHLGTTSTAYLRRVRIDQAHAELRDAEPGQTTVEQVAARWGFAGENTFAAHYRAAYGESPAKTLDDDGSRPASAGPDAAVLREFDALTRRLLDATTVAQALRQIVDAAERIIPSAALVTMTVRAADGETHTVRGHEDTAEPDQYEAVMSTDLPGPLPGVLTVHSRAEIGDTDRAMASLLAAQGALALACATTAAAAELDLAQLRHAIDTRDLIGQAKGILMNRESIDADAAFEMLRRTSQDLNIKLVDLARTLTDRHTELGGS